MEMDKLFYQRESEWNVRLKIQILPMADEDFNQNQVHFTQQLELLNKRITIFEQFLEYFFEYYWPRVLLWALFWVLFWALSWKSTFLSTFLSTQKSTLGSASPTSRDVGGRAGFILREKSLRNSAFLFHGTSGEQFLRLHQPLQSIQGYLPPSQLHVLLTSVQHRPCNLGRVCSHPWQNSEMGSGGFLHDTLLISSSVHQLLQI